MENIFLPLHLLSLTYIAWNVVRADHMGFMWIRGKAEKLNENTIKKLHRGTWFGISLMIITGLFLFWPLRDYLLTRPQFYIKMAFVVTLIANSFAIEKLSHTATVKSFASLSTKEKLPLFISGAISTTSWVGATLTAFFLVSE